MLQKINGKTKSSQTLAIPRVDIKIMHYLRRNIFFDCILFDRTTVQWSSTGGPWAISSIQTHSTIPWSKKLLIELVVVQLREDWVLKKCSESLDPTGSTQETFYQIYFDMNFTLTFIVIHHHEMCQCEFICQAVQQNSLWTNPRNEIGHVHAWELSLGLDTAKKDGPSVAQVEFVRGGPYIGHVYHITSGPVVVTDRFGPQIPPTIWPVVEYHQKQPSLTEPLGKIVSYLINRQNNCCPVVLDTWPLTPLVLSSSKPNNGSLTSLSKSSPVFRCLPLQRFKYDKHFFLKLTETFYLNSGFTLPINAI